ESTDITLVQQTYIQASETDQEKMEHLIDMLEDSEDVQDMHHKMEESVLSSQGMFSYINGIVTLIQEDGVVLDVQGIGYEINCANPYEFQSLLNEKTLIYTYHHVREDAMTLYGFKTEDEKYLFTKLISVSGIGPKSAISILGTVDVNEFISAVEAENEKYLTQFPGVGKKTARQI